MIKVRNFQALIDNNYSHSNHQKNIPEATETDESQELLKQMVQLNLRITS